jgi:hypothetical protein
MVIATTSLSAGTGLGSPAAFVKRWAFIVILHQIKSLKPGSDSGDAYGGAVIIGIDG